MTAFDRTEIIAGPALMQYGGQTFWSKGDVTCNLPVKTFKLPTAQWGDVDERPSDRKVEVKFEPSGRFTSGLSALLWPYASTAIGASIFGANDSALVVWGRDGQKLTVHNAAIVPMPALRIAVDKTISGPVTFVGILAENKMPGEALSLWTLATATYPGDTGFAVSDIKTLPGAAAWGASAPWNDFHTVDGWEINFDMKLSEQTADGLGTVDIILQDLTVTAKATPLEPTLAQVMAKLPVNGGLGATTAGGDNLVITCASGGPVVTLKAAALMEAPAAWGGATRRIGACKWVATRVFSAGAGTPLFSVTVAA